ncbi:LytR/AlgR family response regulator transcription factor [Marinicella rhabdoformis]|uniref:LytR/AlgR family response regulator transcription factor n=1 Tax=Marinicella rhabdoformis TaxID=2580566 RepID=UPI0012AED62B|nr:LytTR family DNA-binding domain-containing protein [Marinicella rhabdoformis]
MKILIADDEPLARMRLRNMLQHAGHNDVIEAQDGEEAIKLTDQHMPDLLFLDIQMPKKSGLEAAQSIKAKHPALPIVFCTAHDEFALKAFDLSAEDYVLKPVTMDRLNQALHKVGCVEQQEKIVVKQGVNSLAIPVDEMICFVAEDKYVVAHVSDNNFLLDCTLIQLENKYPQLLRLHRNCLVHRAFLKGIHIDENHKAHALLKDLDLQPAISRRQLAAVKIELKS